ncbi:YceG-like family protein [Eubacterium ruminantium]|uniref:YceG-like family protein n=1 Tax=Eubacterium ruminantium TaxID=42322 RepID=A0A1T4MFQ2_9FIRM|nr:endolytic transglycosylase MltG [Eubacterium ruminantium]SCW47693.1 YceG-like family protein [Eubacterium ruminantium]SDM55740.1 YceG-like family protein [Eubacterium ruminantium]SJZ65618.1 YceG-like family protein [Eubacterium ruminantium]
MKVKYYLRGIGIGVLLGVLIMFAAMKTLGYEKSDGSVRTAVADENAKKEKPTPPKDKKTEASTNIKTEVTTEVLTTEKVTTEKQTTEATTKATTEITTEATTEATTEKKTEEVTTEKATEEPAKTSDETVTIVVESGMYSEEVAERLMEAGIIDDAYDFNIWLESTGYATALEVGEFQVKKGMSYEEIAKVLTRVY